MPGIGAAAVGTGATMDVLEKPLEDAHVAVHQYVYLIVRAGCLQKKKTTGRKAKGWGEWLSVLRWGKAERAAREHGKLTRMILYTSIHVRDTCTMVPSSMDADIGIDGTQARRRCAVCGRDEMRLPVRDGAEGHEGVSVD